MRSCIYAYLHILKFFGTNKEQMTNIILLAFIGVPVYFMGRILACWLRVRAGGPALTDALLRGGVTFGALWHGKVPNRGTGSLVPAREGLWMEANSDGELEVDKTRTVARDIF